MRKLLAFAAGTLLLASCTKQDVQDKPDASDLSTTGTIEGRCASAEVLAQQIVADPARGRFLDDLEVKTQHFKSNARANVILYVPVVVQVVLKNPALVTDAQINSQIDVLNKDYHHLNTELNNTSVYTAALGYANVADCKIQFVLKQIKRVTTTKATFGTNDAVKKTAKGGSNPINPTTWLNLWVCDLSSGLLGYAQFPGGSSATDGVVIDYQGFGTSAATTGYSLYSAYNLGRSATHEIGHWFNLRHIWGDARCGNDQVADTPLHDASNSGCPSSTLRSTCTGTPLEQWMNYMDYTDDRCMYLFSAGQKTRMDAAIDGARAAYVSTTP